MKQYVDPVYIEVLKKRGGGMNHTSMVRTFELSSGAPKAAAIFAAMGNDRRIEILSVLLRHGELSVNVLADKTQLSPSALSQHLKRLRECDLVSTRREGTAVHYRVCAPVVEPLLTTYMRIERSAIIPNG